MRWPWQAPTRSEEERWAAEQAVAFARSHLRVLVSELQKTLDRVEDKRRRMRDAG